MDIVETKSPYMAESREEVTKEGEWFLNTHNSLPGLDEPDRKFVLDKEWLKVVRGNRTKGNCASLNEVTEYLDRFVRETSLAFEITEGTHKEGMNFIKNSYETGSINIIGTGDQWDKDSGSGNYVTDMRFPKMLSKHAEYLLGDKIVVPAMVLVTNKESVCLDHTIVIDRANYLANIKARELRSKGQHVSEIELAFIALSCLETILRGSDREHDFIIKEMVRRHAVYVCKKDNTTGGRRLKNNINIKIIRSDKRMSREHDKLLNAYQVISQLEYDPEGAKNKSSKTHQVVAWFYLLAVVLLSILTAALNFARRENVFERLTDAVSVLTTLLVSVFGLLKLQSEDQNVIRNTLRGFKVLRHFRDLERLIKLDSQEIMLMLIDTGVDVSDWIAPFGACTLEVEANGELRNTTGLLEETALRRGFIQRGGKLICNRFGEAGKEWQTDQHKTHVKHFQWFPGHALRRPTSYIVRPFTALKGTELKLKVGKTSMSTAREIRCVLEELEEVEVNVELSTPKIEMISVYDEMMGQAVRGDVDAQLVVMWSAHYEQELGICRKIVLRAVIAQYQNERDFHSACPNDKKNKEDVRAAMAKKDRCRNSKSRLARNDVVMHEGEGACQSKIPLRLRLSEEALLFCNSVM